jgi:hypothetical protein
MRELFRGSVAMATGEEGKSHKRKAKSEKGKAGEGGRALILKFV